MNSRDGNGWWGVAAAPTLMGGRGAPDDLQMGYRTQEWLVSSNDSEALTSGGYWYHLERRPPHPAVSDHAFQDLLLQALAAETGVQIGGTHHEQQLKE